MDWQFPLGSGGVQLVTADWLADRLDGDLRIIDAQPDVHDYIVEHIPGAAYYPDKALRQHFGCIPSGYAPTPALAAEMGQLGLYRDTPTLVYTAIGAFRHSGDGLDQCMLAYSLARLGMGQVYVLQGGLDAWKAEGRPLTQDYPCLTATTFLAGARTDFAISMEELRSLKDTRDTLILDARPRDLYLGKGPWSRPGHIPGAVSLPWRSLMVEGNPALLRPADEVAALLAAAGVTEDRNIVCYCGTGRESTNEFLLLRYYLGYPRVHNYEGSFTEWSAYVANETVTGDRPR
ncbi:MAG: sulfurtransferase [Anaerolineae bacterium]